jgi:hypothetical protein
VRIRGYQASETDLGYISLGEAAAVRSVAIFVARLSRPYIHSLLERNVQRGRAKDFARGQQFSTPTSSGGVVVELVTHNCLMTRRRVPMSDGRVISRSLHTTAWTT